MNISPFNLIKKGAMGILEGGKDFFKDQNAGGIIKNTITGIPKATKDLVKGTGEFSADKKLGIARNTVTGIPKATKDVAVDIAQAAARGVGTVGITAGNLPTQIVNEFTKNDQPLPFEKEIDTSGSKVSRILFGGKPIRDLEGTGRNISSKVQDFQQSLIDTQIAKQNKPLLDRITKTESEISRLEKELNSFNPKTKSDIDTYTKKAQQYNDLIQTFNSDVATYKNIQKFGQQEKKDNKGLNFALGFGGVLLDLSGFGGKKGVTKFVEGEVPEQFIKFLAKTGDEAVLARTFKEIGLTDDVLAKRLASEIAPLTDKQAVKDALIAFDTAPQKRLAAEAADVAEKKAAGTLNKTPLAPVAGGTKAEIPAEIRAQMKTFVDYANDSKAIKDLGLEEDAARMAEDFGIIDNAKVKTPKTLAAAIADKLYQYDGIRPVIAPKITSKAIVSKEIPEALKPLAKANPELFRKAQKAANSEEFIKLVVGKGSESSVDKTVLRNFFKRVNPDVPSNAGSRALSPLQAASKSPKPPAPVKIPREVMPVDRLISEGKIRVVSRDGRDVYQVKKGQNWVNTRDEDSAIRQVTRETTPPGPLTAQALEKKAMLDDTISMSKDRLSEHPGKILQRFQSKKEGQFLDFANPDRAKTPSERAAIIARNEKIMRKAESALEGTGVADEFDNPDAIRAQIDDYKASQERLKDLKSSRRSILEEIKSNRALESRKEARPAPVAREEARSLEESAQQVHAELDPTMQKEISSLPKIVINTATNVKEKINMLDYIRTPEKVLEKIGFGPEVRALRKGYEAYVAELPKNIDKITAWSKRVPTKEGNQKIFLWLDGQKDIGLTSAEKEVATEIQAWLKEWADRLKLPEDNRISNYITHIFDDQLLKKEFDEDLAKIIAERIPGQVYDPFVLKRLGAKGFKVDTWAALDAYVKRATRKVNMDDALEMIQNKAGSTLDMSNIEASQFKYVQRFINNVNMRPTELDNLIDNGIKQMFGYRFGQRPVARITRTLRQATYRGMLGLNPASAIRNLSQGINTYATLGEKYTTIGYASLFKKGAMQELKDQGVLSASFVQDRALSATKKTLEKMDKVLFGMFEMAERVNRGAAYFGAKSLGLKKGMSEAEAIEYAKSIVRKTQFAYGAIDTPVALNGDLMKTLLQFKSFTIKQGEFLGGMAKGAVKGDEKLKNLAGLLRYTVAGLAFVYTIGKAFGMKPEELLPNPFGRDKVVDTPPSLKLPVEIGSAVLDRPDKYGKPRDLKKKLEDIGKAAIGIIPAGNQLKKTFEGIMATREGGSFDKAGRLQFEVGNSKFEKVQNVLFGKYANDNAQAYFDKQAGDSKKIKPVYDQIQAMKETDPQAAIDAFDALSDEEKTLYKKYKSALKTQETMAGKKAILPTFQEIRALKAAGKSEEAVAAYDALSEDQQKYYQLVKKEYEKNAKAAAGTKPEYADNEPQTAAGLVNTVLTYAKAIGVDPITAFDRIFTGQKIRYVANGTVVVERLPLEESQAIKEARGGKNTEMKLDHIIPLQLGGSNTESNLALVPTAEWETYTPIENALGTALRAKKINHKRAQKLITDFKNGIITAEEVLAQLE